MTGSLAGCRPGAHTAVPIVSETLGASVLPTYNTAGLIEFGTGNEFATAERMRKIALVQALDNALPMYNHLR